MRASCRTTQFLERQRAAFTLVEVLLALGMLMLVLAATYSALILFQQVTVAGRNDAEQSQLIRAIERRMSADIQSVLFREAEPVAVSNEPTDTGGFYQATDGLGAADDPGETTTGTSSTATATMPSIPTFLDPAEAYATQSVGVFGDSATLVLHVSKPARQSTPTPEINPFEASSVSAVPRATDLRSISYFLSSGPGAAFGGGVSTSSATYSSDSTGQGLARLDGDRLAIQQAEAFGAVDQFAQQAAILAPEVTELQFRYFDGTTWLSEWDTVASNALPRAVEVTLRIEVDSNVETVTSPHSAVPTTSNVYRFVVPLPLSDPTQGVAL